MQNLSCEQVFNKTSEMWKETTNQPSSKSQIMGCWNWQLQWLKLHARNEDITIDSGGLQKRT